LAAFFLIAPCRFHTTSNRTCRPCRFFQMGVILFWVIDESPHQVRTGRLLELASKSVAALILVSGLPFMRPLRKNVLQLIEIAIGQQTI
jgi:hypothetical protein